MQSLSRLELQASSATGLVDTSACSYAPYCTLRSSRLRLLSYRIVIIVKLEYLTFEPWYQVAFQLPLQDIRRVIDSVDAPYSMASAPFAIYHSNVDDGEHDNSIRYRFLTHVCV